MFGMRSFRASEHDRTLLLLAAFMVVLLAGISTTMASSASALSLIDGLRRDLGAIRAQLEQADQTPLETGRQSVAFNTDLGDGSAAFRHRSIATILRSAKRRLDSLAKGYGHAGDARRAEVVEQAQRELQELSGRLHDLGTAADPDGAAWARQHLQAEALIDRLQDKLVLLLPRPATGRSDLG
jgi:hypothetical protein